MPLQETSPHGNGGLHLSLLSSLASNSYRRKRRKIDVDESVPPRPSDAVESGETQTIGVVIDESSEEDGDDHAPTTNIDPFYQHFEGISTTEILDAISAMQQNEWKVHRQQCGLDMSILSALPDCKTTNSLQGRSSRLKESVGLTLKKRLGEHAEDALSGMEPIMENLRDHVFNFEDVLFPLRQVSNASALRQLGCIHVLNHLLKTRDRIIKNNARLTKEDSEAEVEHRDQGFTRPKALILLPTRQACARYADTLVSLYSPEQQENKKRFQESFSAPTEDLSAEKPEDFREIFGGNDDDLFRIGIKFTRKSVKFFSKFYNSDIILASPLGLRMAMGQGESKAANADFLSSVEVLLIDQADALYMQNWEHVEFIIEHTGLQPQESHGCDFSRIRNWYLDGHAKFIRQTIAFSSYNFAPLNRLFTENMNNIAGKSKFVSSTEGVIARLSITPKQSFCRFPFGKVVDEPDERFKYFTSAVLPKMIDTIRISRSEAGVLIFVPNYADFLRVRNYMAAASDMQDIAFGAISEYTPVKDVARARTHFISGRYPVLLYTERVHHFRRYHLKGVRQILMYALPENPLFYQEIVEGFLSSSLAIGKVGIRDTEVKLLFSRLDVLKLERIVGTDRYRALINEDGDTFDFVG